MTVITTKYLESEEKVKVLLDSESVKQNIMLRANPKILSDLVHVSEDTIPIDFRTTTTRSEQT